MSNKTLPMLHIRRIIQLKIAGHSNRHIARVCNLSRTTVDQYVSRSITSGKPLEELLQLDDEALSCYLLTSEAVVVSDKRYEDLSKRLPQIAEDLKKHRVTRMIIWEDYRKEVPDGYSYAQFCEHVSRYVDSRKAVMHLEHEPGEELFFDFAGDKLAYINADTGEKIYCPLFIGILPFSGLLYADPFQSAKRAELLSGMNDMVQYFGGVTASMKTDNMAQIVKKANRYEPVFNELVNQWSLHYNTTLLATRVAKPRDKAAVESAVNTVYHRIYAVLAGKTAFSLRQLKEQVRECLEALNNRKLQNRDYSRRERFIALEKHLLRPLPEKAFVPKTTVEAKVQRNYHVTLGEDKHHYSVPYQFIGQTVKVIYDTDHVEIYLNHKRIAAHQRDYRKHSYTTLAEHMPSNHKAYLAQRGWTDDYFIEKADAIGTNTGEAMRRVLQQKIFKEQTYNSCLGILRLAATYSPERLEAACTRALKGPKITYGSLREILKRNLDQQLQTDLFTLPQDHGNIRGGKTYEN